MCKNATFAENFLEILTIHQLIKLAVSVYKTQGVTPMKMESCIEILKAISDANEGANAVINSSAAVEITVMAT